MNSKDPGECANTPGAVADWIGVDMAKRTVQCAQCGADVDSIGVGRPRKYCDQCRPRTYKPKSHMTAKRCSNCDTQFETPNRERIYCSRACAAAARMTIKPF